MKGLRARFTSERRIETSTTTGTSTATSTPKRMVNLVCMQGAVDKRDTAIVVAVDKLSVSWKKAVETRKGVLVSAWKIEDTKARREALRAAWNAYNKEHKVARDMFKTDRRLAWKQFETDRKLCGKNVQTDDATNERVDAVNLN